MKKRILLISLTLLLILTVGCKNKNIDKAGNTGKVGEVKYEIGISSYILSVENKELLKTLGLEETNILSFIAPRTVKNIKANIYILEEDGTWEKTDDLSKKIEDRYFDSDDVLKGSFSMILNSMNTEKMTIKLNSSTKSMTRDEEEYQIYRGDSISSNVFLSEFKNIELNKEIPVAIIVENKGEEINSYNLNSFFEIDDFDEIDYVEAVTLVFED